MSIIEKLIVFAIIMLLAICVASPYFEARSFNRFSKENATYWDAVFLNLRVQANK